MTTLGVPCPECNQSIEELWEYRCEEGDNDIWCPHCNKAIILRLTIGYSYEAKKRLT